MMALNRIYLHWNVDVTELLPLNWKYLQRNDEELLTNIDGMFSKWKHLHIRIPPYRCLILVLFFNISLNMVQISSILTKIYPLNQCCSNMVLILSMLDNDFRPESKRHFKLSVSWIKCIYIWPDFWRISFDLSLYFSE